MVNKMQMANETKQYHFGHGPSVWPTLKCWVSFLNPTYDLEIFTYGFG